MEAFLRDHPDLPRVDPGGSGGIRDALCALGERDVDVIAVSGGDGTLQRTLTELLSGNGGIFSRMPLVAPLRAGRTSMSALDIGSHRLPTHALARLMRGARDNSLVQRIVERPVLRVDLGSGQATQYGMFFGVGLIQRAIKLTHRVFPHGRAQGVFGSSVVTFSLLARHLVGEKDGILDPDPLTIRLDGEAVSGNLFRLVIATTLRRLFLRINPFWGRGAGPIRFTALDPASTRHVMSILRVLRGKPPRREPHDGDAGFTSRNVFSGELEFACGLTIDGEMFRPSEGHKVTLSADERIRFVRS